MTATQARGKRPEQTSSGVHCLWFASVCFSMGSQPPGTLGLWPSSASSSKHAPSAAWPGMEHGVSAATQTQSVVQRDLAIKPRTKEPHNSSPSPGRMGSSTMGQWALQWPVAHETEKATKAA